MGDLRKRLPIKHREVLLRGTGLNGTLPAMMNAPKPLIFSSPVLPDNYAIGPTSSIEDRPRDMEVVDKMEAQDDHVALSWADLEAIAIKHKTGG